MMASAPTGPMQHEIFRVMKLGTFVNIDKLHWDRIKAYLEAQGAIVIEDFPNSHATRQFNTHPGPKKHAKRRLA